MCVLVTLSLALVEKEVSYTGLVKNSIEAGQPQPWGFYSGTRDSLCSVLVVLGPCGCVQKELGPKEQKWGC